MEIILFARQGVLFLHLCVFAIAFAEIVRGDLRLLRLTRIDPVALHRTAQIVGLSLAALWATGLALVILDTGFDLAAIAAKPKLITKVLVVTALTINGVLLHRYAFPMLTARKPLRPRALAWISALGAISSVSWLYAAFVGSARLVAAVLPLQGFLALYGIGLAAGIAIAVIVIAPLLSKRLAHSQPRQLRAVEDEAKWAADSDGALPAPIDEALRKIA